MQRALRERFAQWGLPARVRVDNGTPWATWSDLPPALVLWWLGLGIEPIWNQPHCPRENPQGERCNGLIDQWGEPQRCPDYREWERRLVWLEQVQRAEYPAGGSARLATHPELLQPRRPSAAAQAASQWQLGRVLRYLAQGRWPRWVSKIGPIHVYGQPYRVGRPYVGRQVWVEVDPQRCEGVVRAAEGQELRRHPAAQLTPERICQLQVAHPRPAHQKRKAT